MVKQMYTDRQRSTKTRLYRRKLYQSVSVLLCVCAVQVKYVLILPLHIAKVCMCECVRLPTKRLDRIRFL